ncbi:MAG: hypothetical protein LQ337_008395 [Flavoplaca oasis]|nr:MAG: hypothetical protein LQ337_008395 [Flavoplaca oasis]
MDQEKQSHVSEKEILAVAERDVLALARLGKKPILKRRFTSFSILGFTCTILITWEAELMCAKLPSLGGSAGLIYSYLWESWQVCWLVICGWQAILAGSAYLGGNMIIALARLNHASYEPALWQGKFVYWCVMAVAILVNVYTSKILPKLESFILVLHIGGFIAVLVPLVVMSKEKVLTKDVFTVFENGGGRPTTTVSVFCMLTTTILNGILGFAMLLAILYVTTDISSALSSPTGIFRSATGSIPSATAMICIIIIMDIFAAVAFLATSSRIVFAFGRNKGLPFWQTMAKV